jgi:4'-phosphopantetheinyl transferase EntD
MHSNHPVRRADRLIGLFDRPVAGVEATGVISESVLHPEEIRFVERAIEKRRLEFAAGRLCARLALAEIGFDDAPLRVGEKRSPAWPRGAFGSITHARGYCGAVAAPSTDFAGIGVDAELRGRLGPRLWRSTCTEAEIGWLESLPEPQRNEMATVIFSAKEAFYKCQFCVTRDWLGFHDVTLEIGEGEFRVELHREIEAFRGRTLPLSGRYFIGDEHVFAGIAVEPE